MKKLDNDIFEITKTREAMGLEEGILEYVKKEGIEEGIEKGIKKGIKKGIEKGQQAIIFRLFDSGFDALQISEMLKMEIETIEKFKIAFDNQPEAEGDAKTDEEIFDDEDVILNDEEE